MSEAKKAKAFGTLPPLPVRAERTNSRRYISEDVALKQRVIEMYQGVKGIGLILYRDVIIGTSASSSTCLIPGATLIDNLLVDDEGGEIESWPVVSKDGAPGEIRTVQHKKERGEAAEEDAT